MWLANAQQETISEIILSVTSERAEATLIGPVGYYASTLHKMSDGTWERRYKKGGKALFNALGQQVAYEDPWGRQVLYQYEGLRLTRIQYPLGQHIEFQYDPNGKIQKILDHLGRETRFEMDEKDVRSITISTDSKHEFEYFSDGKLKLHKETGL